MLTWCKSTKIFHFKMLMLTVLPFQNFHSVFVVVVETIGWNLHEFVKCFSQLQSAFLAKKRSSEKCYPAHRSDWADSWQALRLWTCNTSICVARTPLSLPLRPRCLKELASRHPQLSNGCRLNAQCNPFSHNSQSLLPSNGVTQADCGSGLEKCLGFTKTCLARFPVWAFNLDWQHRIVGINVNKITTLHLLCWRTEQKQTLEIFEGANWKKKLNSHWCSVDFGCLNPLRPSQKHRFNWKRPMGACMRDGV